MIVFSEWQRMLEMVRELAGEMGIEAAWHTGSVPQQRRRAEIVRFKQDPACRLFLSTDSGSVGLNLQAANAVVNVDLPWNPAKLEQRIARAWRKHQMRSVTVVNLVCENSIEHGMVHLLGAKQALADGVLDGQGDLASLKMPSGRGAMIERIEALMQAGDRPAAGPARIVSPEDVLAADLRQRHGACALLIEARQGADGRVQLLAVLDLDQKALAAEAERLAAMGTDGPAVEVIDVATWRILCRLQSTGLLQLCGGETRTLHRSPSLSEDETAAAERLRAARAAALRAEADRALRKARVLVAGGFAEEAPGLLAAAIGHAGAAKLLEQGEAAADLSLATPAQIRDLVETKSLPLQALATLDIVTPASAAHSLSCDEVERLLASTAEILGISER